MAVKTRSIASRESDERQMLRLVRSPTDVLNRSADLARGFSDKDSIIILQESFIGNSLSFVARAEESKDQPWVDPALPQQTFAQEFWRTIGHARWSESYAAYLGRYSGESAQERVAPDPDALSRIDQEERKRLDARRADTLLHVTEFDRLLEVPKPRRAPRGASFKKRVKAARQGCRNRIWRCALDAPITPVAQGSAQRFRSRHN
jgi:hypothetical protein